MGRREGGRKRRPAHTLVSGFLREPMMFLSLPPPKTC